MNPDRVTVMGLGLFGGGAGAARFLASRGARVTVTDLRAPEKLAPSIEALADLDIRFVLGRHDEADFTDTDMVVVNPAVPPGNPLLQKARDAGVTLEAEIHLFLENCPAKVIGVTGSNGKTTTTSLLAAMIRAGGHTTWLGGNIGRSLLDTLPSIEPDHTVVLELSSFQLEQLRRFKMSPHISVVTNLTPNHLDWHGTFEAYADSKMQIVRDQVPSDVAILNAADPEVSRWAPSIRSRIQWFSLGSPTEPGLYSHDGLVRHTDDPGAVLFRSHEFALPGGFNLANAMAAAAAALAHGIPPGAIRTAVGDFKAVEHRLELVSRAGGADWYNDSVSTTPESTMAALSALPSPLILIAGGHDKGLALETLAREALERSAAIVALGPMGERFTDVLRQVGDEEDLRRVSIEMAPRLAEAVNAARRLAPNGARIVLSPATSSYDEFTNFAERGRRFKELVRALED